MPTYKFKALNKQGVRFEETIDAESLVEAMLEIDKKGLSLLEINPESILKALLIKKGVSKKELSIFAKQLSYLVGTGIPIHRGLEIIADQTNNNFFKRKLNKVIQDLKEGVPLSQCMSKHPGVFPESMIYQLKAAESGGFMEETLVNISINFDRDSSFSSKIKGAMIYPVIILFVAFAIVYFMLISVVPKMSNTLNSFDAELPPITQMVMRISELASQYWYLFFGGLGLLIYGCYVLLQNESNLRIWHRFLLKIPKIGKLIIGINIAKMSRVMASLLSSGVPIDDTLDNISNVVNNRIIRDTLLLVKKDVVEQGFSLSKALELQPIFPKTLVQVVAVGEESGSISEVLKNYAENIEDEVESLLKVVTNLINPILMIIIGIIVGVIVLALFTPMFALMDAL